MAATDEWIVRLRDDDLVQIDAALEAVTQSGLDLLAVRPTDFPLGSLADRMVSIRNDLEGGRGFALIRALPVDRYKQDDIERIFWGMGVHVGTPEPQDKAGNLLHHVRDTGNSIHRDANLRAYQTNMKIPFHNDGSDAFMLLCRCPAKSGGRSVMVSASSLYNEILRRRPDLVEALCEPFHFDARGQQPEGMPRCQVLPVFNIHEGRLNVMYKRDYIDLAQRFEESPRLSNKQIEALDLLDEIANDEEFRLEFDMEPGDTLVGNNYEILHSRTSFQDFHDLKRRRHMLRLWLTLPKGRPLPPIFETTREFRHSYARRKRTGNADPRTRGGPTTRIDAIRRGS
jgi:hypothetical protein